MSGQFVISDTRPEDQPEIEHLLDLSFGIGRRTKTSYRLREGSHAADGLSLLIRDDQLGIAGAISFWPLRIGADGTPALLLGPLAVHPERQNLGIGLALMGEGLARAKTQGHRLAILVGDEPYYARVGFKKLPDGLLIMPGPADPGRMLYLEIVLGALQGVAGLVLPPHRFRRHDGQPASAAFAVPHGADGEEQGAQT
ncbi:MAG: N-acetyltransferase [Rhizobiales bacterium]|nr:N-acetyltransferase [Hyphomicrobiales bacterium]